MKDIVIVVAMLLAVPAVCGAIVYDQDLLERRAASSRMPKDCISPEEEEAPVVPARERDAIKEHFSNFITRGGWTTNQFIEGLIYAATNYMDDANWANEKNRRKVYGAFGTLSDINHPMVTNFFRSVNNTNIRGCHDITLPGLVQYSHLEPELLDYLKGFCVQTNIYDHLATHMMMEMFECYNTLPEAEKPAAKVRLAKYMYFAIHHTTRQMAWQDRELAKFIPAYSNSLQRLSAMQYVYSTATNERQRVRASMEIERMSQLGTNQLNDVLWIAQ